jgi:hypothetical protein
LEENIFEFFDRVMLPRLDALGNKGYPVEQNSRNWVLFKLVRDAKYHE